MRMSEAGHRLRSVGNSVEQIIERMRANAANIRFADACKVAERYFGSPRQSRSSHVVYRMPWGSDPRVNLQDSNDRAKPYQIKQLLAAIDRVHNGE